MSVSLDLPSQRPEPLLTFVFPALSWFEHVRLLICDVFWAGEMLFPVYQEDEAARCIYSYDIGSPPCFCSGAFWDPTPTPPHRCLQGILPASETQGQIPHLPLSSLIFKGSPCQGTELARQADILQMVLGPHPPPVECPPPCLLALSSCSPGLKVFHLQPRALPLSPPLP